MHNLYQDQLRSLEAELFFCPLYLQPTGHSRYFSPY